MRGKEQTDAYDAEALVGPGRTFTSAALGGRRQSAVLTTPYGTSDIDGSVTNQPTRTTEADKKCGNITYKYIRIPCYNESRRIS